MDCFGRAFVWLGARGFVAIAGGGAGKLTPLRLLLLDDRPTCHRFQHLEPSSAGSGSQLPLYVLLVDQAQLGRAKARGFHRCTSYLNIEC